MGSRVFGDDHHQRRRNEDGPEFELTVILPLAARAARKDADAFAGRIKAAVEAS
jgi:hypothetical protein